MQALLLQYWVAGSEQRESSKSLHVLKQDETPLLQASADTQSLGPAQHGGPALSQQTLLVHCRPAAQVLAPLDTQLLPTPASGSQRPPLQKKPEAQSLDVAQLVAHVGGAWLVALVQAIATKLAQSC